MPRRGPCKRHALTPTCTMVMVFYATDLVALMTTCRACRGTRMYMFMPLGDHPPANSFVRPGREQDEVRFSLDIHACLDCGLIQVPNVIPAGFFREYVYVPSVSETMHKHFS